LRVEVEAGVIRLVEGPLPASKPPAESEAPASLARGLDVVM
jgi:hypothetical protein